MRQHEAPHERERVRHWRALHRGHLEQEDTRGAKQQDLARGRCIAPNTPAHLLEVVLVDLPYSGDADLRAHRHYMRGSRRAGELWPTCERIRAGTQSCVLCEGGRRCAGQKCSRARETADFPWRAPTRNRARTRKRKGAQKHRREAAGGSTIAPQAHLPEHILSLKYLPRLSNAQKREELPATGAHDFLSTHE